MADDRLDVKALPAPDVSREEADKVCAAVVLTPELAALRVIQGAEKDSGFGDLIDIAAIGRQLREQAAAVNRGDLSHAEAMLINQATALQSLFARLAERGMGCEQHSAFEANMRMALRAQSQCRATLETLAAIKNPPMIFARQANISHGHQQVNNAPTRAEKNQNQPNELLTEGVYHGATLDTGRTGKTSGANQELEAVGTVNRR